MGGTEGFLLYLDPVFNVQKLQRIRKSLRSNIGWKTAWLDYKSITRKRNFLPFELIEQNISLH